MTAIRCIGQLLGVIAMLTTVLVFVVVAAIATAAWRLFTLPMRVWEGWR